MPFSSLNLASPDREPGNRGLVPGKRALGIIYFSSNPLPSIIYQLSSSALVAEVNSCSWGKGEGSCVAEIKCLFASFVELFL
jgi:hypothetical protein